MDERNRIIALVKKHATANGGQPLGSALFEQATGIGRPTWGLYWASFGDLTIEAGYKPNTLKGRSDPKKLVASLAALTRKVGKVPVSGHFRIEARSNPGFPAHTVLSNLGDRSVRARLVVEWCRSNPGNEDVATISSSYLDELGEDLNEPVDTAQAGFVYMMKSGKRYKLGKTFSIEKRFAGLSAQVAHELIQVHAIATDDPTGIEAYWLNRFKDKRKHGEWFELSASDVAAFKRRTRFM